MEIKCKKCNKQINLTGKERKFWCHYCLQGYSSICKDNNITFELIKEEYPSIWYPKKLQEAAEKINKLNEELKEERKKDRDIEKLHKQYLFMRNKCLDVEFRLTQREEEIKKLKSYLTAINIIKEAQNKIKEENGEEKML